MDDHLAEFGKYRILGELGRGGMGVVYLAEDGLLNRKVALKVLYDHLNRESAFVSRFQEEARSVSSLHHRNIVCVHGMERASNAFAIDMEYVDGLSLDRFAAVTRIAPPLAARLGSDILEGLVTCHDIGIVHRDIKPSNILVGQDSVAKITDFGLATAYALHVKTTITGGSSNGYFMGTPRYASPAAWDGQSPIPAWDLYSLGVILFELLSGRIAFAGESPMAIMKQHLTTALPPVGQVAPTVSRELACVVESLLEAKGEPTSLTSLDVLKALQQTPEFDQAKSSESNSTVTLAVRRHKIRRRAIALRPWVTRALLASAGIVVAGAGVWVAYLLTRPGPDPDPKPPIASVSARLDTPEVFLRPQSVDGVLQDGTLWMLTNDIKGKPQSIVALNALGLWHLTLVPAEGENKFAVKGSWAEYLRSGNARTSNGEVSGFMLIAPEAGSLSLSLERVSDLDNSRERLSLVARPVKESFDRPRFIQALESNDAVQSLLYSELIPGGIEWARAIELAMPSFADGRMEVQRTTGEIEIDGVMGEDTWIRPPFNQLGRLGEMRQREIGEARMLVRWIADDVVIGIDAEKIPMGARLDIALLPGVQISVNNSRRFFASLDKHVVSKTRSMAGARELPWECDWEGQTTLRDGHFQAELRIPISQLAEHAAPREGRRWRINASLRGADSDTPLAYWGFQDGDAPEHGAMLIFREAKS